MKKIAIILCLVSNLTFGDYREFKNKEGNIIEAKVLSIEGNVIKIERSDGREFSIPLAALSKEDAEYIEAEYIKPLELAKAKEKEEQRRKEEEFEALKSDLFEKYPVDETMSKLEAKEAHRQGYNHQQNKEFEKAVSTWASIPEKHDEYADARRRAGFNVLGRELGDWNKAVIFLLDAYEAEPKNKDILEDLGRAYQRLDDFENAKIYLSEAKTKNAKEALKEIEKMESNQSQ